VIGIKFANRDYGPSGKKPDIEVGDQDEPLPLLGSSTVAYSYPTKITTNPPIIVYDLQTLNSLNNSTTSIIVKELRGWPSANDTNKSPITASSSTTPFLTKISVYGQITEQMLSELLEAFALRLEELELEMQELCLGGRQDKSGVATLRPMFLPTLKNLRILNANGCPLTVWVLAWDLRSCSNIDFCSSYIDEATYEMLKVAGAPHLRLGLFDTGVCRNCELTEPRFTVKCSKLKCPSQNISELY
jgi:hypothetical protein